MSYTYISDEKKLLQVFDLLDQHSDEVKEYFASSLSPRVTSVESTNERLRILFTIANADRQGTGEENINLRKATATFYKSLDKKVSECRNLNPAKGHKSFWEFLCDIEGMNQKTANLFLKYVVIFQRDFNLESFWSLWIDELHVPLDIWVLRLLGTNYLKIGNSAYEHDFFKEDKRKSAEKGKTVGDYPSPTFRQKRYKDLQEDLKKCAQLANKPAIVLDSLWFVGSKWCNPRPLLCDICWLKNVCSWVVGKIPINWSTEETGSKTQKRINQKSVHAYFMEMQKRWLLQNPGKSVSDFDKSVGLWVSQNPGKPVSEFFKNL